ncbi:SusF/SusE family outer membrane protein [Persicobacter psychrovividus]|uniref:SusE outer membrane protein domain-containing protein n=1 Tax=Persicobacter psychrovividus TaxID=387638 RepID=A0ABM7VBF6_9BACT|nr:hypothetical protein PEPS_05580 [Persicobacter psychrovividus]
MKYGYKLMMLLLGSVLMFSACSEDLSYPRLDSNDYVAPKMDHSFDQEAYQIKKSQFDEEWSSFEWTKAEYGLAVIPHYSVQLINGNKSVNVVTVSGLTASVKYEALNNACLAAGMEPGVPTKVKVCVTSNFTGRESIQSNTSEVTITPILVGVTPQHIFKVGSAQDWNENDDQTFQLYETDPGVFVGNFYLEKDEEFKILPTKGWGDDKGGDFFTTKSDDITGDGNMKFEGASGNYQLIVDMNKQSIQTGAVKMFIKTGTEVGWDNASENFPLYNLYDNIYRGRFQLVTDEQFKIITKIGSWDDALGYNEVTLSGATFAEDGGNIVFKDATTDFEMIVDLDDSSLTVKEME